MPPKRKLQLSDAERKARSDRAKAMREETVVDPETGEERPKFGGRENALKSVEARKQRAAESVAEEASKPERRTEIVDALFAGLDKRNSAGERRRAALAILDLERKERLDALTERRELEQAQRDELMGRLLARLGGGDSGGTGRDENVIDGEIVHDDAGGTEPDPDGVRALGRGEGTED